MTVRLDGGTVVITGGAGLLGGGFARAFAARGSRIVITDMHADRAEDAAARLRQDTGASVLAIGLDVTDRASADAAAERLFASGDGVDVLINNAGLAIVKPFVELTRDDWDRVLDVQLHGVINLTTAFLPGLTAQERPSHILNVASMSGVGRADLRVDNAPYVAAKFAVTGLSEAMGPALAPHGIGVSVLCPGFTRADPSTASFPLPSAEWYRGNVLTPDEVAEESVAGVIEGRLHIFPHRAGRQEVLDRHQLLMEGFDQAAVTSPGVSEHRS